MAEVKLQIASREYIVTCRDGEEDHLIKLGAMVDTKAQEAGGNAAGLNESRLLLFAALMLADDANTAASEASDTSPSTNGSAQTDDSKAIEMAAISIEKLALRAESFAESLEQFTK